MRKLFTSLLLICALSALVIPQSLVNGPASVRGQGVVRRAAAGGSSTVVYDTFTAADNTFIDAHSGETGATWTLFGPDNAYITNNRLNGGGDGLRTYPSGAPASADYDVQFPLTVLSDSASFYSYARFRWDTATDDGYRCGYKGSGQKWIIEKITGGGFSELGNFAQVLSTSTTYVCRCRIQGTSIKLDVDAVERISVTDATWSATGKTGIDISTVQANTTGYHFDYLWVGPNGGTVGP